MSKQPRKRLLALNVFDFVFEVVLRKQGIERGGKTPSFIAINRSLAPSGCRFAHIENLKTLYRKWL